VGAPLTIPPLVTNILAFVFVLGVLIFVHELGHFLMARRIGVRVLTFSLGFGPKLLKFRRGDTEYCISAIPLGGYVKMAGENPDDARTGAADEFLSKTKWQRFQVLVMGPVMNLVLALIVMALVLYQGAQVPAFEERQPEIGSFVENSVAAAAGLQVGDRIIALNDKPVETWKQFGLTIATRANRQVKLLVDRNGKQLEFQVVPAAVGRFEMGDLGILPPLHPQVFAVTSGEPAEQAGVKIDDVILGAAGEKNVTLDRTIELIKSHENKPMELVVRRGDQILTLTATPRRVGNDVMLGLRMYRGEHRTVEPGFTDAVRLSFKQNWEWTVLIVQTLGGLFTRETPVKQLMGPVAIAGLSGDAAQAGWIQLFTLMAMISLNLGLLNLMPIPVLDGGHIAILALEGLSRRDFSMKVKEKMLLAGFVLLLMLMVTVIYNDLTRIQWIERLMPWR
jgi:regulator of sigma E protease